MDPDEIPAGYVCMNGIDTPGQRYKVGRYVVRFDHQQNRTIVTWSEPEPVNVTQPWANGILQERYFNRYISLTGIREHLTIKDINRLMNLA
jgi:hypothetical protein